MYKRTSTQLLANKRSLKEIVREAQEAVNLALREAEGTGEVKTGQSFVRGMVKGKPEVQGSTQESITLSISLPNGSEAIGHQHTPVFTSNIIKHFSYISDLAAKHGVDTENLGSLSQRII
jgi:hypothetical protein